MSSNIKQQIDQYRQQVEQLYQQGQYEQAIGFAQRVRDLAFEYFGDEHPEFAGILNDLALLYYSIGRYEDAESLYLKAMEIYRKGPGGEEHPEFATSLNNLAVLYRKISRYLDAEPLYLKAVEIRRKALGEEHPRFAQSLSNLAMLYYSIGRYVDAEPLYLKAIEIYRKLPDCEENPSFATSLNNLGLLYDSMGRYSNAELQYLKAIEIRRRIFGEEHPSFATSLNNLGLLYDHMGRFADAEAQHLKAMEIRRRILGEEHSDLAQSLDNLGGLYYSMGRYEDAEPLIYQAIEIRRKTLGVEHPDFATSLNNLMVIYGILDRYSDAESLGLRAMKIYHEAFGEEHPAFTANLNNLALLYDNMGRYLDAESLFSKVIEIERKTLGEEHPEFAISLNNLGLLLSATDREAEALTMMEKASAIDNKMIGQIFSIGSESQRMDYIKTLRGNFDGFISLVHSFFSKDQHALQTCLNLILRRKAIGLEALAIQRDVILSGRYPELEPKLRELSILRMQIAQKTLAGPGPEGLETHRGWLSEWNVKKEQLESDLAHQIPEMNIEQKMREIDRKAIASALPEGSALLEFVRFDIFDFKAIPAKGESKWKPARYIAFFLLAGKPDNIQMIDLGEAEKVDGMIARFREGITGERGLGEEGHIRSAEDEGNMLRETVFDPVMSLIADKKRIFISPDGDLTRLPFEVLPLDGGRRLIDEYHISYLGAGRDIIRYKDKSSGRPDEPLVIADPNFDLKDETGTYQRGNSSKIQLENKGHYSRISRDVGSISFKRLPGTHIEGENIGKMLKVAPWLESSALEGSLKARRSPRILHIATHGFFLKDQKYDSNQFRLGEMGRMSGPAMENPLLRSGLALAGANTFSKGGTPPKEAEDGILTAEDVSGLDLFDTELVVLSACDTGIGEIRTGEGVFGLRRAFVLAGARTLVMSLWKVPDKETQELMEDFYKHILQGKPRAEALRDAQLAMKARHPEPKYWGAFICQGDFSPLPNV